MTTRTKCTLQTDRRSRGIPDGCKLHVHMTWTLTARLKLAIKTSEALQTMMLAGMKGTADTRYAADDRLVLTIAHSGCCEGTKP